MLAFDVQKAVKAKKEIKNMAKKVFINSDMFKPDFCKFNLFRTKVQPNFIG